MNWGSRIKLPCSYIPALMLHTSSYVLLHTSSYVYWHCDLRHARALHFLFSLYM